MSVTTQQQWPTSTRQAASQPSSGAPIRDFAAARPPMLSADGNYVVLPVRVAAEMMTLPWQQQLAGLLDQFTQEHAHAPWPVYQVTPCAYQYVANLGPEQQQACGVMADIDSEGDLVYRQVEGGSRIEHPEQRQVLAPQSYDPLTDQ